MSASFSSEPKSEYLHRLMVQISTDTISLMGKFNHQGEFIGTVDDLNELQSVRHFIAPKEASGSRDQKKASKRDLEGLKKELGRADTILDLIAFAPDVWESEIKRELESVGRLATYVRVVHSLLSSTTEAWYLKDGDYGRAVLEMLAKELKKKSESSFQRLNWEVDNRAHARDPYARGMKKLLHDKRTVATFFDYDRALEHYSMEAQAKGLVLKKTECWELYRQYVRNYGAPFLQDEGLVVDINEADTAPVGSNIPECIVSRLRKLRSVEILSEILKRVPHDRK